MTPNDKARLLALADEWQRRERTTDIGPDYGAGLSDGYQIAKTELRALVAEFEREDGDG